MRKFVVATGLVAVLALAAACSPAADEKADAAAENAADAAAAGPATAGGAMSPPQGNEAVDTAATLETNLSAGSTSFTEAQARSHIEGAGYTGVTGLTKTPEGLWSGQAMKGGKTMAVAVDFKGAVSAK